MILLVFFRMSYCFHFILLLFLFFIPYSFEHSQSDGVGFDFKQWPIQNALLTGAKIFMGPTTKKK